MDHIANMQKLPVDGVATMLHGPARVASCSTLCPERHPNMIPGRRHEPEFSWMHQLPP
jgi:hypothetical protein